MTLPWVVVDLTGAQWAVLESLLPTGQRGWPPKWTKPQLINEFRWPKRTGAPWRTVPKSIRVPRPGGGRPQRTRPDRVRADKAYSSRANRA